MNEKNTMMQTLNVSKLQAFLYEYADEKIGELPTLRQELAEACRLTAVADIDEGVNNLHDKNIFKSYSARNYVEWTEEERVANSTRKYKAAAAKICWLAAKSRELTGESFIKVKINKASLEDCVMLVTAFAYFIRHPKQW